LIDNWQF